MAIKRIHDGMGIGEDSCVSGVHPNRVEDPPGVYLGINPESPSKGLFLTFWEAMEVACKIGYPTIEVYEAQKALIDEQAAEIAELEHRLDSEIHNLQLKAVSTEIKNVKKEVLGEIVGLTSAIRARLGNSGSDAGTPPGTAKAVGGTKTL